MGKEDIRTRSTKTAKKIEIATPVNNQNKNKQKKPRGKLILILVVILAAVVAVGSFAYYRHQQTPEAKRQRNIQESERVLRKVKRRLLIESNETPTVARVVNPDELRASNQTFYKNVQVGDYVIIYTNRAIIYRNRIDQIINVAPIVKTTTPGTQGQ